MREMGEAQKRKVQCNSANEKKTGLDGEIERESTRLNLSVYRKPTHSGRYLNFNSHHPISAKCSTADALFNRAELITTDATRKDEEFRKVTQELLANDYPSRFVASRLDRAKNRNQQAPSPTSSRRQQEKISTVVMPFVDGVTQPLQRVLKPLNIRVVGRGSQQLGNGAYNTS